jgi:hypothetical protein
MEPTAQWLLEQCLPTLIAKHVASEERRNQLEEQRREIEARLEEWSFITACYSRSVESIRDAIHREGIDLVQIRIACNAIYTRENARHDQSNRAQSADAASGV